MSKASRERERIRNEKYGFKKETIFSQVCDILRSDKTFDDKLDKLNHIIIGSNKNDWELRMKDKKNWELFEEKVDLRNFSGMVLPSINEDSLIVKAIGTDRSFYKEMNNNMSKEELSKLFDLHKIELNLTFKTPLGIARMLHILGKVGEKIINEN